MQETAKIDIFTDSTKTQVKDIVSIMDEVKDKWASLTDVEQKGLSEAIAGKTQAGVFQALMTGWERVRQYQKEYNEGWMIGSAQKENEVFMDSIAGKMNTLKENLKGLLTSNVTTDMFKGLLDGANKVIEAIGKISSSLGKFGSAGALVGISTFVKSLSNFEKLNTMGSVFSKFDSALSGLQANGIMGQIGGTIGNVKDGFDKLTKSVTLSKVAFGLFKGILAGLAFAGVVAGISAVVKALDNYIHATENAVKASKERQDGFRDEAQTLSTKKSNLQEIAKEYDNLNNKSDKTAEDLTKLNELKQQIGQIAPDLVKGYDSAGNPILNLTTSMQGYIAELDKAIAKQQELYNYETKKQAQEYMLSLIHI